MKRLLLILSPYIIFCLIFSVPFIIKPSKHSEKNNNIIDSVNVEQDTINDNTIETIDSLQIIEDNLNEVLLNKEDELILLQDDAEYKLIVGSFKSEIKAGELSDNLSKEGYEPRIIENESLLRVCVAFSNSSEEISEVKRSLEDKGYKPWILKKY